MTEYGDKAREMDTLREEIDRLDERLLEALLARFRVAARVGRVKGGVGAPPLDPPREAAVVRRASAAALEAGVPEEGVREVYWAVLGLCRAAVERGASSVGGGTGAGSGR